MAEQRIRVGIVGAGANTRLRHIPGFRQIPGVEVHGVVNSSLASSQKAAKELGIPKVYSKWEDLVADPEIDAVQIGTWPDLHSVVTCAALNAGKHVLCEARMARNLAEAKQMLDASRAHPELIAQIVPSPFGLEHYESIRFLLSHQYIGDMREMIVIGADDQFWDYSRLLHWRQDSNRSGLNTLAMGILHETASRWVGPTSRVFAQQHIFEPTRPSPLGEISVPVTVPDSVQIVTQLANGARGIYHLSGTILHGPGKQIHLYGSLGTIKIEFGETERAWIGRANEPAMKPLEQPEDKKGGWRVEAEFIGAIRGQEQVHFCTFASAFDYMEFTEAVAISAESGRAVELPLTKLA
ncbi:MAG: ligC [Planctomycetaceae bacterium]|nr:ligC [Planctomycetaceae bacterium]